MCSTSPPHFRHLCRCVDLTRFPSSSNSSTGARRVSNLQAPIFRQYGRGRKALLPNETHGEDHRTRSVTELGDEPLGTVNQQTTCCYRLGLQIRSGHSRNLRLVEMVPVGGLYHPGCTLSSSLVRPTTSSPKSKHSDSMRDSAHS